MNSKFTLALISLLLFFVYSFSQDQNETFWKAAKTNDIKTLKELLDKGIDVNVKTQYGATALMYATDKVHPEAVKLLLEHGANPNLKDSFYGATPFLWSFDKGNISIITEMVNHGADISTEEPMMYSIYGGLKEVELMLLQKGAPGSGQALQAAVRNADSLLVTDILKTTVPDAQNLSQALLTATSMGNQTMIQALLKVGAKLPEKKPVTGSINEALAGTYKAKDETFVTTRIKDAALWLSFNGSPDYALELKDGNEFTFKDIPGINVTFEMVQDIPASLTIVQAGNSTQFFKVADQTAADTLKRKAVFKDIEGNVLQPINWPSFRGNQARGIGDGQYPPLNFDAVKGINLRWKTFIPGLAHSCPIIWKDKVFLTTAMGKDTSAAYRVGLYGDVVPVEDSSFHTWKIYCLDKNSGSILWEKKAYEGIPRVKRHPKATQANATAVTNGEYVVAIFGSEGMICYDLVGNEIWRKDLGILDAGWFFDEETQWGSASSPIIYKNSVIVQCDRSKDSYLAAYDLKTGRELWKTMREEISSWGTPTLYSGPTGDEIITNGSRFIRGNNPLTGEELWRLGPSSEITVATPVVMDDLIFVTAGYAPMQPIFAIKPGGKGNISIADSLNSGPFIQWRTRKGGTYMPTPIAYNGYLYTLNNNGTLTCYDAKSGEKKYRENLKDGEAFTASPVAADGKLYFTSEEKGEIVVKAGPEFEQITRNPIGEICMSTPAISDGMIFIRGQHHLFCFGKK
ncbi:MAG: PQQ-binding-like beta-propeller repeat protein [Bacteroidetes bacterium]|nr:PQQ-binding-like beta-propeller repeat protein [Bacteroidota bacterium]